MLEFSHTEREKAVGLNLQKHCPVLKVSPLIAAGPMKLQPWHFHRGPSHMTVGKGSRHRDILGIQAKNSNGSLRGGVSTK